MPRMNQALVDQIVEAVLYEGYILYPYRPSVKNRQRWTFGGLYPRGFSEAQQTGDAWFMQTECLLRGAANTLVHVVVRFLHLQDRSAGQLDASCADLSQDAEPTFRVVEKLQVGDRLLQTWQEAVAREVVLKGLDLGALVREPRRMEFTCPASRTIEPVRGRTGAIDAILLRAQNAINGAVRVSAEAVGKELYKLSVQIENNTALEHPGGVSREQAVLDALASTHTILSVQNGEFLSLIDPPHECREVAAACVNEGTWPVLVGDHGETDTMLSSPITLYDYPQIAAQSPGEFFDGTEIDEMLVLRIMTMTDEERQSAAAVDERARALLARTSALSENQIKGLHGVVRGLRPVLAGESP
jgi:hydrogenase maturation protease